MSKHTPGPWQISAIPNEREKISIIDADMCFVAEVWKTYVNGESRQQANAALIAAAPAMYEALALVVTEYAKDGYEHDNGCNIFYSNGVCDCTRVKVRIALAQARRD